MKRTLLGLAAAALGVVALSGLGGTADVAAAPSTITVRAGDGESGYAVNQFLPGTVTVEVGSTISWEFPWYEPHIVALADRAEFGDLEPAVPPSESGVTFDGSPVTAQNAIYSDTIFGDPDDPPTWDVTFTKAGSYNYFCPIHPFMDGTVVVVAAGAAGIDTQAAVDDRGDDQYDEAIGDLKALRATIAGTPVAVTTRPDGSREYTLIIGASTPAGDDVMQFIPTTQTIKVGDSIKWVTSTPTPHTVTFGQITPPPGPDFDPFELPPTKPADSYDGTGFFNSGILAASPPGAPAAPPEQTQFTLDFSKAGSFQYYCILHADQDMVGTIVVEAQAPSPTPTATATPTQPPATPTAAPATPTPTRPAPGAPNTGSGLGEDGGSAWLPLAGVVLLAAGAATVTAFATRRSR